MYFPTTAVLLPLLAAAVTAAPIDIPNYVTPNNPYGAWLVRMQYNPTTRSEYISTDYFATGADPMKTNPLTNTCVYAPQDIPVFEKRCDRLGFGYEFDAGESLVSLNMQTKQNDTPVTVFGEGKVEWEETREDGVEIGYVVIQVDRATA